jgi:striatin 1/3/4
VENKKFISLQSTLKSHMDGIRGLRFLQNDSILASGGEDGMLNLWNIDNRNPSYSPEPLRTIRAHSSPILTVTGGVGVNSRLVYTAGADGAIKVWNIPELNILK